MELVARVIVECEDEDIARWAEQDGVDIEEVKGDIKTEVIEAINALRKKTSAYVDFIEWEA